MTSLQTKIQDVFDRANKRSDDRHYEINEIVGANAWDIEINFSIDNETGFRVRSLRDGDIRMLMAFREQLSQRSRDLFCPYPWNESDALEPALGHAIEQTVKQIDAAYIIERKGVPAAHFFLWKGGDNNHPEKYDVQVPELGIAVSDSYHGRGLGGLIVRLLLAIAEQLGADAVELTTAKDNEPAWQTYLRSGFEHVGFIWNPQEVDVTAALAGEVKATIFKQERQMIAIINQSKKQVIEHYLTSNRDDFAELYKRSTASQVR